jgi:hypothetical protein
MTDVIDPIDHAVGTASGAVSVIERRSEPLAHAPRVVQQGTGDELVRGERDRLWEVLGTCLRAVGEMTRS